jgi:hypothetical protein
VSGGGIREGSSFSGWVRPLLKAEREREKEEEKPVLKRENENSKEKG